jgi:MFS family permease
MTGALEVVCLTLIAVVGNFWAVLGLIVVWGLLFAAATPIRQSYLNGLIPSRQRATVLSFDSMMASLGGVGAQPALGRVADVSGYGPSYAAGAGLVACSLPFLWLARRQRAASDVASAPAPTAPA